MAKLIKSLKSATAQLGDLMRSARRFSGPVDWLQWAMVLTTVFLALATLYMAIATRDMARVVRQDFAVRNTPTLGTNTPKIQIKDNKYISNIEFKTINLSTEGRAIDAYHYYLLQTDRGYNLWSGVMVSDGKSVTRLSEFPLDYLPQQHHIHKLGFDETSTDFYSIKSLIVIIKYQTLFDMDSKLHCAGFLQNEDDKDFEDMPRNMLIEKLREIKELKGLEQHLSPNVIEDFIRKS